MNNQQKSIAIFVIASSIYHCAAMERLDKITDRLDEATDDVLACIEKVGDHVKRYVKRATTPPPPSRKLLDAVNVVVCFTHPHWAGHNLFVREHGSAHGIVEFNPAQGGRVIRKGFQEEFHRQLGRHRDAALTRTRSDLYQRRLRGLSETSVRFSVVSFNPHDNDETVARIMKDTIENITKGSGGQAKITVMLHGHGIDPLVTALLATENVDVKVSTITVFSPHREILNMSAYADNIDLRRRVGHIEHHFLDDGLAAAAAVAAEPPARAMHATPGTDALPGADAPSVALLAQLAMAAARPDSFVSEHLIQPKRYLFSAAWLRDNEPLLTRIATILVVAIIGTTLAAA